MNVVIIVDEKKIADKICSLIQKIDPHIKVLSVLDTVKKSIGFFHNNKQVIDLIFSDINLTDGVSFSIFQSASIPTPVVFITRFDEFVMRALEHNGIDYILNPIKEADILRSVVKYKKLQKHFLNNAPIKNFVEYLNATRRTRFIVKWGTDNIALPITDIALFYTRNKMVYTIDKSGKKYIIDRTMSELEEELDKKNFFRVNRQYIVNLNYIKGFRVYERVKLELDLSIPDFEEPILISQDTAPVFKLWISGA